MCVHAGLVVGQKLKIEGKHVRVEQKKALCRRRGTLGAKECSKTPQL